MKALGKAPSWAEHPGSRWLYIPWKILKNTKIIGSSWNSSGAWFVLLRSYFYRSLLFSQSRNADFLNRLSFNSFGQIPKNSCFYGIILDRGYWFVWLRSSLECSSCWMCLVRRNSGRWWERQDGLELAAIKPWSRWWWCGGSRPWWWGGRIEII